MVFPDLSDDELKSISVDVYRHLGRTVGEAFGSGMNVLTDNVLIEPGWDPVDQALKAGKGAIVATGHIGNFELGGTVIAARYPLLDVVKTQRNRKFNSHVDDLRHQRGIRTVPMQNPGRAVLEQLRAGGLVSLLVDQDAGDAGIVTDFLGHPASTWGGAARFSIRTGCPILPMAIIRRSDGQHVLKISPALEPTGLRDCPDDVLMYTEKISKAVEQFILQHPEQWFWVHRRWKGMSRRLDFVGTLPGKPNC